MSKPITIIIIDDDANYFNLVKETILSSIKDVTNINIIHKKDDNFINNKTEADIFIVDHFIFGKEKSIDIIEKIDSFTNISNAHIYVATGYGNYDLLKNLLQKGIAGFIDKNDMSHERLIDKIKEIDCSNKTLEAISTKISKIKNKKAL